MRHVDTASTDQSIRVWAYDSDGAAITGETHSSSGIAASVVVRSAGRIVSTTALTLVARTSVGVHRDSAFSEVGGGEYVIDLPDSYCTTADREVSVTLTSTAISGGYVLSESLEVSAASIGGLTTEQEETLNTIYSQTSQITGSRISSVGPVKPGGDIELIVGKDYKVAAGTNGTHLPIAIADVGGVVYGEFTSGTLAASKSFGMRRDNGNALIAGTVHSVVHSADVTTFKIEIDADQLPDTLDLTDDYTYQIQRVTSTGDKVVGVQGAGAVTLRTV